METPNIDIRNIFSPINKLINGGLDNWQRGTSFTSSSSDQYTVDRFILFENLATGQFTLTQEEDVPSWSNSKYSVKIQTTTAEAAPASAFSTFQHRVEGNMMKGLAGKEMIYAISVKSNRTGTFAASVQAINSLNVLETRISIPFTVNSANTWEIKYIKIPQHVFIDLESGTNRSIQIHVNLGSGTDNDATTDDVWDADGDFSAGKVNISDNLNDYIQLSDMMLYDASHGEIPFQIAGRDFIDELNLCKRYYQFYSNIGLLDDVHLTSPYVSAPPNSSASASMSFEVEMRVVPIVSGIVNAAPPSRITATKKNIVLQMAATSGATTYAIASWIASAEL